MEHYQAMNTPRGPASQNMSTPSGNKCNLNGMDEANLPQELSELCYHQCKVGQVLIKCPFLFYILRVYFNMLSHYLLLSAASFL